MTTRWHSCSFRVPLVYRRRKQHKILARPNVREPWMIKRGSDGGGLTSFTVSVVWAVTFLWCFNIHSWQTRGFNGFGRICRLVFWVGFQFILSSQKTEIRMQIQCLGSQLMSAWADMEWRIQRWHSLLFMVIQGFTIIKMTDFTLDHFNLNFI